MDIDIITDNKLLLYHKKGLLKIDNDIIPLLLCIHLLFIFMTDCWQWRTQFMPHFPLLLVEESVCENWKWDSPVFVTVIHIIYSMIFFLSLCRHQRMILGRVPSIIFRFLFSLLNKCLAFSLFLKKKSIRVNFLRNLLCSMHCPPDTRSQSCLATLCCCCIFFAWEYMYSSYVPCIYIVI